MRRDSVPVAVLRTRSTRVDVWESQEAPTLLAEVERTIREFRPQVLLTYGGDAVARVIIELGKRHGLVVVFGLHNFAYHDPELFRNVDRVIVPSEFSRRWYRERLGLRCEVLPYVIDWNRVEVNRVERTTEDEGVSGRGGEWDRTVRSDALLSTLSPQRFVTFVNPQPAKGLFVFARIAEQIARRRPDIPILVVEGRGRTSWLEQVPVDLSWATNLYAMENTYDPRDFYAVTKLLLVPSLWNESFGLVAAEAMINGIPVLASDRGALPEVMGSRESRAESREPEGTGGQRSEISGEPEEAAGGFIFKIPSCYTPETTSVPMAEEVEPWVQTIIRLWDDCPSYYAASERARACAQRLHPDQVGPAHAAFFGQLKLL
jgi:glycosyltransferase involved in cell wall biosynthesis